MSIRAAAVIVGVTCLCIGGERAGAVPIVNNFGIVDPTQVITFDELTFTTGTLITDQYASLGATFSPGMCYNVQPVFFPTASLSSFGFGAPCLSGNNSIHFNGMVSGAAVALQSNPLDTTFTALLNGSIVESFTAATALSFLPDLSHASDYYGFTGILFDELRISNSQSVFQIDNLQFRAVAVPEPGSVTLLVAGLLALGAARLRRRVIPDRGAIGPN